MRFFLLLACLVSIGVLAQPPVPLESTAALVPPTGSVSPANPYEAVVPITDTSPATEAAALREALALVIAGVTGLPDARTNAGVMGLLDQASSFAQRYGDERDPATQALMFRAAFDPAGVDAALKRAGLPVFGLVAGAEQEWPVDVRAVNDFHDYGRAVSTLRKLRGVKAVQVQTVEGDRLQLLVRFEGDAQALSRAMANSGVFMPAYAGGGGLQFALQPG